MKHVANGCISDTGAQKVSILVATPFHQEQLEHFKVGYLEISLILHVAYRVPILSGRIMKTGVQQFTIHSVLLFPFTGTILLKEVPILQNSHLHALKFSRPLHDVSLPLHLNGIHFSSSDHCNSKNALNFNPIHPPSTTGKSNDTTKVVNYNHRKTERS